MIEITVDVRDNYKYDIKGHALFAPKGKDIVCAAVSTLHFVYMAALKQRGIDFKYTSGEESISCKSSECEPYFEMVILGFKMLADTYKDNVKIIFLNE